MFSFVLNQFHHGIFCTCSLRLTMETKGKKIPFETSEYWIRFIRSAFAMSGEGVPTLQADQLNVITHHLHTMKTKEDLWTDKSDWPIPIDSPDVMTERLKISRLTRRRVQQLEPNVWVFFDHHLQIKNAFAVKGQDSSPLYHSTGNFKGFRACLGSYCFPSWRKFWHKDA